MEFKLPERKQISNKSTYGRVLNVAGSDYMSGAAYLSSVSALKVGCGYCFLCSSDNVIRAVAAQTSNVVFMPLSKLQEGVENADVVEIGCGLSLSDDYAGVLLTTVFENLNPDKPLIIDADALNLLSKDKYKQFYMAKNFNNVILTPHPKEAARLLGVDLNDVLSDINKSAEKISALYNCVTVLKTHNTYVCSPDGKNYTNNCANSALAKAGSGDVLTGIISGLTAQGAEVFEAACLGVRLHSLCAKVAAEHLTQYSVMADDLIKSIPDAIRSLL